MSVRKASNVDLLTVLDHGFKTMEQEGCEGFEYIIGEVKGGKLKISFEPDDIAVCDTAVIDGVDGFGYTLVYEDEA